MNLSFSLGDRLLSGDRIFFGLKFCGSNFYNSGVQMHISSQTAWQKFRIHLLNSRHPCSEPTGQRGISGAVHSLIDRKNRG